MSREPTPSAEHDGDAILPAEVPVRMPELPLRLTLTTDEQLRAISDPTRVRILGIIQHQPATAKQIAHRLGQPPSTIGHHLQVLEEGGLAQVVARRLVHGIVAKYYTRTARIFSFELPPEIAGGQSSSLSIMTQARDELAESGAAYGPEGCLDASYPRARISPERARIYVERLGALVMDFLSEPVDPDGQVYAFASALFLAPPFAQALSQDGEADERADVAAESGAGTGASGAESALADEPDERDTF